MQEINDSEDTFNIFKGANELLKMNGHFVITLPSTRAYSIDSDTLERLGFKEVFNGVTWNTILQTEPDGKLEDSIELKLRGMKFYVLILEKTGTVRESEITNADKMQLIPQEVKGPGRPSGKASDPIPTGPTDEVIIGLQRRVPVPDSMLSAGTSVIRPDGATRTLDPEHIAGVMDEGLSSSEKDTFREDNKDFFRHCQEEIAKFQKEIAEEEGTGGDAILTQNLQGARAAINNGADEEAVKRRFLESHPTKSGLFDEYVHGY